MAKDKILDIFIILEENCCNLKRPICDFKTFLALDLHFLFNSKVNLKYEKYENV